MKNKELDNILDIINFSKSIENLYTKLATLEKQGKIDSDEYDDMHSLISSCIEIENKKYKQIDNFLSDDIVEIQKLIEDLNHRTEDDYLNVTELTNDNRHTRLFTHLRDISLLRAEGEPASKEEEKPEEGKGMIIEIGGLKFRLNQKQADKTGLFKTEPTEEEKQAEKENHKVVCDLMYYKYALINSYFMDYLLEEIENCKNKNLRKRLIDYKYKLIYSTFTLERLFAKDKKNFTKTALYEMIIEKNAEINKIEYDYAYSKKLEKEMEDVIKNVSQANFISKEASINEKVTSIVKTLYAKAMLSAMYDEEALNTMNLYYDASKISCASSDDLKNMDIIFDQDKIRKLSKKVD